MDPTTTVTVSLAALGSAVFTLIAAVAAWVHLRRDVADHAKAIGRLKEQTLANTKFRERIETIQEYVREERSDRIVIGPVGTPPRVDP